MSTEYEILRRAPGSSPRRITLDEHSSVVSLNMGHMAVPLEHLEYQEAASDLTADEIALMAVEMIKVASYLDPEAIQRTAQKLGEKPDWDYYQGVIRELL